jgi:hypothetical protein
LIETLRRVTAIDTSRPMRTSRGSSCSSIAAQARAGIAPSAVDGRLQIQDGALYITASRDVVLSGLALSVSAADGATLEWIASASVTPSLVDGGNPGFMAVAWLDPLQLSAGQPVLLGQVTGSSQLRIVGVSANENGSRRAIRFTGPAIHH